MNSTSNQFHCKKQITYNCWSLKISRIFINKLLIRYKYEVFLFLMLFYYISPGNSRRFLARSTKVAYYLSLKKALILAKDLPLSNLNIRKRLVLCRFASNRIGYFLLRESSFNLSKGG